LFVKQQVLGRTYNAVIPCDKAGSTYTLTVM